MLKLACHAKVNLALAVGAPAADRDGLHPIASWMTIVQLADQLTLVRSDDAHSHFDITFEPGAGGRVDWPPERDLARRARALLEQHTGMPLPVHLTLRKRIPPGAGLGGGSSNAAATLVGLRRLFGLDVSDALLLELGLRLGSDVGFLVCALLGTPAALVGGFGDRIEALQVPTTLHLVLVFPGFGSPTGQVYAAFDRLGATRTDAPDEAKVRALAGQSPLRPETLFNDLAAPALAVNPQLGQVKAQVEHVLGLPVHVTGSGSTLFVVAPDERSAAALADEMTARTGLAAHATATVPDELH